MCSSKKEKDNFGRLCWVLIEVGSLVLTEIFNKVCLPENLDVDLKDNANRCKLESLRKKRILSVSQWSKLYPVDESSPVSSRDFDTSLQLILLRSIYGLNLPASGQNDFPPATDTSPVAGITCMKVLRDRIHHHDTSGSVDDPTFSSYWFDIKEIFMRFGGYWYLDTINRLEFDCLDEDLAEDYQKQLREWLRDDAFMKDKLEGRIVKKARKYEDMEGLIGISKQISGREGQCNILVDTESLSHSGVSTVFENFIRSSLTAKYAPETLRTFSVPFKKYSFENQNNNLMFCKIVYKCAKPCN